MTYEFLNVEELEKYNLGLEIQDFTEPNLSDEEILKAVKSYKQKLKNFKGIRAMHGPFLDLKPASPDKDIARLSQIKYLKTLEIAKELEIDYLIFHSQINYHNMDDFIKDINLDQNANFWKVFSKKANDFKGIFLLENVFEEDPYILKELLDRVNLDNVRLNLDIGHAKISKFSIEKWVHVLKDYLVYSHVHSNDGQFDKHYPISREEVLEYYGILSKFKINPILSLEYNYERLEDELVKFK